MFILSHCWNVVMRLWYATCNTDVTWLAVSGMAQWLGRRSLADGLSPIYAWSMLTCAHFVDKVSTVITYPGQLILPSLWGRQMSSNPHYMRVETIKRQTRAGYGCLVAGQSPWARAWTLSYRLNILSVCDTKAPLQQQFWCYISVIFICLCLCLKIIIWIILYFHN